MAFAPPRTWSRRRDRRLSTCRDEAVGNRRFVQCVVGRGPLDLETCCLRARLAARPRRFQALEGGAAPGGAGAKRLRRGDLGVHGLFVLLCSQPAPGLPPPVGLPPRRGRGSHECPAYECLAARLFGRGYSRYHLRRSALHTTMARGTEARSSQSCDRSRRARLAGRLAGVGPDAIDATRRQKRQATKITHRELNGSSMFMSRSMLFDTDAMQPRAANDARGTTSTAQPPLPRCS